MNDDLDTVSRRLATTAHDVMPAQPPADLWRRGRRARRRRQVATGLGAAAAAVALVLPAAAIAGFLPQADRAGDVAADPDGAAYLALPDRLYAPPSDAPRERAPGPLAAAYGFFVGGSGRERVAGVSAEDGRTVILPGVPASTVYGFAGGPSIALSADGDLLAYLRGRAFETGTLKRAGSEELVVRDLRSGEEIVTDLPPDLVRDYSTLRPMAFSGGVLMVSVDHAPKQSLYAVDPATGEVTTLVPRSNPLTFPGAASDVSTFTVDRRVYVGARPAEGRDPDLRGPRGYTLGPAAASPDGSRLAVITSELLDGTKPEPPELQVFDTAGSGPAYVLPLPSDGQIRAWLPDGRIAVAQPDLLTEEQDVTDVQWMLVDPDGAGDARQRVIDVRDIDSYGLVVAADMLANPLRPAVDPDPFPVIAVAAGGALAAVGVGALVLIRRRRRAAR